MPADTLIQQTISRFPRWAQHQRSPEIEPVEKGGSDRNYYRLRGPDGDSLILVKYGDSREENRHYCAIAAFLAVLGIHVPEIYFHDEAERLIGMQDLGEIDLWASRDEPWPRRRALYALALDELAALHAFAHSAHAQAEIPLQAGFNADLYRWEQNYFFENCLGRFFGITDPACDREALEQIALALDGKPSVLVHRDFQSQNILLHGKHAHLIDFQGLRAGLPGYDLASLIYDPYVTLAAAEREELVHLYLEKCIDLGMEIPADFHATLDLCAMQRLMQALGAYGFLGLVKGRTQFLAHIPAALASLREVAARIPTLRDFPKLLEKL